MTRLAIAEAGGPNVCAFLDMLAVSEIGRALLALSDDGYNVLVGSTPSHPLLFHSYARHPNIYNAATNSHAAGRYEFMTDTWTGLRVHLNLTDFGPENQDRGAIELLRECHAYPQIVGGNVQGAITLARKIWASLPGAGYGQHENSMSSLVDVFNASLPKYKAQFDNVQAGVATTAPKES